MGIKKLVSKKIKHTRRKHQDFIEFEKVGSVTDDKLRRESMGLITDLNGRCRLCEICKKIF